jgi:hypothetical protein
MLNETKSSAVIEFDVKNGTGKTVGSVSGIVHYDMIYLLNFLKTEKADDDIIEYVKENIVLPVAILKNINIRDDYKNMGYGRRGLYEFLNNTDTDQILLISDEGEYNDFDLTRWYESLGFEQIGKIGGLPFMLLNK